MKNLGGYHLACDARNSVAVRYLRDRKFRKEKPFALMAGSLEIARELVELSESAEELLASVARPVVLARAKASLDGVSPGNGDLGVMLPYAPVHHSLFAAGAPGVLVMTSANRSSEPIAYRDEEATESLAGIADAFLIGERRIARRVDDSIVRAGSFGPVILRRARGYAPSAVTAIPSGASILATGADLKNTITLVVNGQALVSQHIGDLDQYESLQAFRTPRTRISHALVMDSQRRGVHPATTHPRPCQPIRTTSPSGAACFWLGLVVRAAPFALRRKRSRYSESSSPCGAELCGLFRFSRFWPAAHIW